MSASASNSEARHRLRLASDRPVQAQALAALRPRGGLPMTAEPA